MTALYDWDHASSPLNNPGGARCGVWSPALSLFVVGGYTSGDTTTLMTSPDAVHWTSRGNPFGAAGEVFGIAWSPALGLFVAVGNNGALNISIVTSPDGVTWTSHGNPAGAGIASSNAVAWSATQAQFVATGFCSGGGVGSDVAVVTSPDGVVWTQQATPADGLGGYVEGITYSPWLDLWVGCGLYRTGPGNRQIMTSPDGIVWTAQSTPLDGSSEQMIGICSSTPLGEVFATGQVQALRSADGTTWTLATNPFSLNGAAITTATGTLLFADGNNNGEIASSPDGTTWTSELQGLTWSRALGILYGDGMVVALGSGGVSGDNVFFGVPAPPPGSNSPVFNNGFRVVD